MGGYLDSVEEDRELRNRAIGCGLLFYYLEEPLLTKIETGVSLTVSEDTGYQGVQRKDDREIVWKRVEAIKRAENINDLKKELLVPVDLSDVRITLVSNPDILTLNKEIPHILPVNGLFKTKQAAIA